MQVTVRPTHERLPDRVRAHVFLCMTVSCFERYVREGWRELRFADTAQRDQAARDAMAPA